MTHHRIIIAISVAAIVLTTHLSTAQVSISADGSSPHGSAMLEVKSDTAGILIPRMTQTQRTLINSPATGLMVYQTDQAAGFYYFNGSGWTLVGAGVLGIDDLTDGKTDATSVFLGPGAGANDDGTNSNVAVGVGALHDNVSGYQNTAIGYNALNENTANYNTATGFWALKSNTTGSENTAFGYMALRSNTTGLDNTGVGYGALDNNTTGHYNTAIGTQAMVHNNGHYNVAYGFQTLFYNTSGYKNTALGSMALFNNSTGRYNVVAGYKANYYNQAGSDNTILGYEAGMGPSLHSKSGNIFIGYQAGYNDTTDNKLYIENSDSSTPLIYGDFSRDSASVNGEFSVTQGAYLATTSGNVGIGTTSPSAKLEENGNAMADTLYAEAFSSHSPLQLQTNGTTRIYVDDTIGNVGIGTCSPSSSAILDLASLNQGLLLPRLDSSQVSQVQNPDPGLIAYNTTDSTVRFFNGSVWKPLALGNEPDIIPSLPPVTDIDGNTYPVVTIGTQYWMAKNLAVTRYNDSTEIPLVTDYAVWEDLTSPGHCWYSNDSATWAEAYGALYNFYAVADTNSRNVCPEGWHVPSDAEWSTLATYLGGEGVAGGKMKSTRTDPDPHPRWNNPNTGATNESGFIGFPGGLRNYDGLFSDLGYFGLFWSSSPNNATSAWYCSLNYGSDGVSRYDSYREGGFSVRCLKD